MSDAIGAGDRVRVLVVEDSEDQRTLLRTYFERAGCDVTAVENAEDGVTAYQGGCPDLAVVDLVLPGMNGFDLVQKLRDEQPDCAIAVTSVLPTTQFPSAEAFLPKPFTRAQILQVLRDCVPRWQAA